MPPAKKSGRAANHGNGPIEEGPASVLDLGADPEKP